MTQQPLDPMDKLLREALASDATPPADLADRIMERVSHTPQERPASRKNNPYRKWAISAAACLVLAAAALPMALNSHKNAADMAAPTLEGAPQSSDTSAYTDDSTDSRTNTSGQQECSDNNVLSKKDEDGFTTVPNGIQADLSDQPYDPMDAALDNAAEVLEYQGYTLEILARADTAVQVTATDGSGHSPDDPAILENAMTAAGFTLKDGWYTLAQEVAP